jgi:trimeric autotransporter adhesin
MKTSGYLRLLAAVVLGAFALMASEYHGSVTSAGLPIPGATVTATQGDKKVQAITDGMGTYSFPDLTDGMWTITVEMSGFATEKQDVMVEPNAPPTKFEIKMKSLNDIQAQVQATQLTEQRTAPPAEANTARPVPASGSKGKQQAQAASKAAAPAQQQAVAEVPAQDDSSRAADGFLVNGSQVNGGSTPFALNPAFGNNRRGARSLYTYQLSFILDNSSTDARNYSLTGQLQQKPYYNNYTINGSIQGPLRIPHLFRNGPNFFVQYFIQRNRNSSSATGLMPTDAERNGDLSGLTGQIIDPATGTPFAGNVIPKNLISPQAAALLALFPQPNFSGSTAYNYQTPLVGISHVQGFNSRMNKQIGRKNAIQGQFALFSSNSTTPNIFGFTDRTSVLNWNFDPVWRHQFTPRMSSTLEFRATRQAPHQYSYFSNLNNVAGNAGITGNYQSPLYWGPPSLSFGASGISGLSDGLPSFNRIQTGQAKSDSTWNHGRHTVTFGGDALRQDYSYYSETNPRGTLGFTGAATVLPGQFPGTANPLADFLLGVPDTASLAFGNADKYLRSTGYDLYLGDDWRVNSALTLNLTMRYEYNAPFSEEYGRLVNLDVQGDFAGAAPVLGNQTTGSLTGQKYPSSLIRPDRLPLEPGMGLAWRPISGSSLVVRAGYALRFPSPGYIGLAQNMFQQAPLSQSVNNSNSPTTPLTLANPFYSSSQYAAQTFGIDPNFQESYVQNWTLSIQKDLPAGMQMLATYQGIKGTRLPQMFYPNSYVGQIDPFTGPVGFLYETSNGNSHREAGSIQLRRRLHNGFTAQVLYTYAKSIDDTGSTAQNWLNLAGETGLSSFDQRQNAQITLQYTSGMGLGGGSLISGWKAAALKEWTILTPIVWGTGLPETPSYPVALGGTTAMVLRPEYTGQPLYTNQPGVYLNAGAFGSPPAGQFGNAGVGTITGPAQFSFNATLQRTFRLSDRTTMNFQVASTNILNHVVYGSYITTLGDQFGVPAAANAMRKMTIRADFRF